MSSLEALVTGTVTIVGEHPDASNGVFIVDVTAGSTTTRALYKPISGERHLWDFPRGELARREVLTFALARAMHFTFVPDTVWRDDAPAGPGSLQRWIEPATTHDVAISTSVEAGWCHILDAQLSDGAPVVLVHRDLEDLRALAFFDAIVNNGDRKAGHILRDVSGDLFAIDHGVTFHADPKLRTVLWGFAGQRIPDDLLDRCDVDVRSVPEITETLDAVELEALQSRIALLKATKVHPAPDPSWPSIPWPIY